MTRTRSQDGSDGTEATPERPGTAAASRTAVGLPGRVRACLFDLDGVLTQTARVHAAAWREMFDAYLRVHAQRTGEPFVAFDPVSDYDAFVDGKPRADGARSFLTARGIELPVFEDALAGVAAGRAGGFGFEVGVDRVGQAKQLTAHGADVVVADLAELLVAS